MGIIAESRPIRVPISSYSERVLSNSQPLEQQGAWLTDYEKLEGNIFKYYNLKNEVEFIKKVDNLPYEKKQYYLQENVMRFLGEFVGEVPYTTIPYEIDNKGISYAGMYVMDSYRKAAELGGQREKAETKGFEQVESVYKDALSSSNTLPNGAWISPPKISNYGFVFVFVPDGAGNVKEYILRYPEKMGDLKKSNEIYSTLSPQTSAPLTANGYLTQPLFDDPTTSQDKTLNEVMRSVGITENKINESQLFEKSINSALSGWIATYSSLVLSLASYEPGSQFYNLGVTQAKKLLLSIYQKAQEIKREISSSQKTLSVSKSLFDKPVSQAELSYYAAALSAQKELPTTDGGSCPAIETTDSGPLSDKGIPSMSNFTILSILSQKTPIKAVVESGYFNCPSCGYPIPSGKGIETCPNESCGMTKAKAGSVCD